MRRHLLLLLVITSSLPALSQAGWFTKEEKPPSCEQLIRNEERLTAAQQEIHNQRQRLQSQQQTISQLNTAIIAVAAGSVLLLIIGVALGSKAKRD